MHPVQLIWIIGAAAIVLAVCPVGTSQCGVTAPSWESVAGLNSCPKTGPHRACLTTGVRWPNWEIAGEAIHRGDEVLVAYVVNVDGRLNGGERRAFRIEFVVPYSSPMGEGPGDTVAYLGRSLQNRPVILTAQGPLEILNDKVDVDLTPTVVVIDEKNWRLIAQYAGLGTIPTIRTRRGDVTAWLGEGTACVSAPQRQPGALTLSRAACDPPDSEADIINQFGLSKLYAPAAGTDIARLQRLVPKLGRLQLWDNSNDGTDFGGDGWTVRPYRLAAKHILVVIMFCSDCN